MLAERSTRRAFPVPALAVAGAVAAYALLARARRIGFQGKTVLISGGSRGLGLELARIFAGENADLILLARNEDNLSRAATELRKYGVRVMTHVCDVTDPEQVKRAVAAIKESAGTVDILVNNAGTIQVGPVENMTLEDYRSAMAVHFWGPLYLMNEILPQMRARRAGRIINIASIGGKVAVPHLTPYSASKFALVGLSQSLRAELLKDGIYVTTVCPGLMRTGSHLNAYFKGQQKKEYALFAISNASPLFSTSAEAAARKIVEACRYGRAEITITPQAKALRLISGIFPGAVSEAFGLLNRALPSADGAAGDRAQTGAQSRSPLSASALTLPADRAATRNNELAGNENVGPVTPAEERNSPQTAAECACTHPTHFIGRCHAEVSPPAQLCGECMENHFQPVDDPAI
jgi:short-subunit dehydrogenase